MVECWWFSHPGESADLESRASSARLPTRLHPHSPLGGGGLVTKSCDPTDCSLSGSSVHEDCPGKNTGVGCHWLLQGIFLTQGSNSGLPHCRQILYCLSQGCPQIRKRHLCWFTRKHFYLGFLLFTPLVTKVFYCKLISLFSCWCSIFMKIQQWSIWQILF